MERLRIDRDRVDRIADRIDIVHILIFDLDVELVLERNHDVDEPGRVYLEIFEDVGHYPHCEAPVRFVEVLTEFIESTVPAQITVERRHLLGPTAEQPRRVAPQPGHSMA